MILISLDNGSISIINLVPVKTSSDENLVSLPSTQITVGASINSTGKTIIS